MTGKYLVIYLIAFILNCMACTKPRTGMETPPVTGKGKITARGIPSGALVQKTIGAAGGILTDERDGISIFVPAGAVNSNTEFAIQPITSTLPNGLGSGFRLLPEGTIFNLPVTLSFNYTGEMTEGTVPDLLYVAFQDREGIWQAQNNPVVDEPAKTITVQSTHFSDWGIFTTFKLTATKKTLDYEEQSILRIEQVSIFEASPGDALNRGPVGEVTDYSSQEWSLTGEGALQASGATAVYSAPATTPVSNPVTVNAKIRNIKTNKGVNGVILLLAPIRIGDEYIDLVYKGSHHITNVSCQEDVVLSISGSAGGTDGIQLKINGNGVGDFIFEEPISLFNTQAGFGFGTDLYETYYPVCGSVGLKQTNGSITVSKFGNHGAYIEGVFSGSIAKQNLPSDQICSPQIIPFSGKFRVRRP